VTVYASSYQEDPVVIPAITYRQPHDGLPDEPTQVQLLHRVLAELGELRAIIQGTRKDYYTVDELARLTGRTAYTVRRWITEGRLQAIRVEGTGPRGRLLVPGSQLGQLLPQGLGSEIPTTATPTGTSRSDRATNSAADDHTDNSDAI
jgi:excisionase family DNA binding protein